MIRLLIEVSGGSKESERKTIDSFQDFLLSEFENGKAVSIVKVHVMPENESWSFGEPVEKK